jgi:hypothetical protein
MSLAMSLVAALVVTSGGEASVPEKTPVALPLTLELPQDVQGSSRSLRALYGSYFALQGADVYSTVVARRTGAREVNPVMEGTVGQALAVKAIAGLTTYYAINRMAKTNRKAAIVTLAILNGITAAVVANNIKTASR